MTARRGFTLLDQILLLVLTGILFSLGFISSHKLRDLLSVTAASRATKEALAYAREYSAASGLRTAVGFDNQMGRIAVHAKNDSILTIDLMQTFGTELLSTRDSMAYLPSGLGYGASNLTLVISKGNAADTLTISRLGRVR